MSHAFLSPSGAHRWLNCTPSARLESEFPQSTSSYAAEGTLAHSVCELCARKKFKGMTTRNFNASLKKLKADPLWNDEMLATAGTYVENLSELFMSFSEAPHIAMETKVDLSDYIPGAYGTCDCIMIGGDRLVITDYKHGKGVPVSADNNPQLMLYALGALKLYWPIYGDTIEWVHLFIDQPRLNIYEPHTMTASDLLEWGESIVKPRAAIAFSGDGDFAPGEWCRFCRAKTQCRANADRHTAIEDFKDFLPDAENAKSPELLSVSEIGEILTRFSGYAEWYNELKAYALAMRLQGQDVPGWKAVEGRSIRTWSDPEKAIAAILAAGYEREVVYNTVPQSLAQLEKLIGQERFKELVGELIVKPPGKPTLVPESDGRPDYSSVNADFAKL